MLLPLFLLLPNAAQRIEIFWRWVMRAYDGGGGGKQVRGQFVAIKGATYGEINGRIFGAQPTLVHKVSAVRLIRPYICVGGTFRVCDEQKQDITALDGFPQRGSSVGAVLGARGDVDCVKNPCAVCPPSGSQPFDHDYSERLVNGG